MVNFNCHLSSIEPGRTDVLCDDLAILHLQYSTQWDGLAHAGSAFDADGDGVAEAVYYNGYRGGEHIIGPEHVEDCGVPESRVSESSSAAKALGIEKMAQRCVQGRGVLLDLKANYGIGRTLVGYDDLLRALDKDRVEVETGDVLCLHTGFAERVLGMKKQPDHAVLSSYGAVLNGRDQRLLQWISESGIAALAADNYAVEAFPATAGGDCCAALPLHEHCLFKLGLHLGELWRLTPLAEWLRAHGRCRFLLTAPPLNLTGAIASPLTPIGTV
jgi:kynurenine formamidase